jgi:ubiquitin carboxyl-terminal hydrolase L5
MAQYEGEQIQFNLLSLCRSPTLSLPEMLAMSAYTLMIIEAQLNDVQPDWRDFVDGLILNSCIRGPDVNFAVTQEALDLAVAPHISGISAESLLDAWRDECTSQERLRRAFLEETGSIEQDAARANSRRHDYTPMVYRWIHMLAENGVLKSLVTTGESW